MNMQNYQISSNAELKKVLVITSFKHQKVIIDRLLHFLNSSTENDVLTDNIKLNKTLKTLAVLCMN